MASPAKRPYLEGKAEEVNVTDSICGFVHNVSCVRTSTRNRCKFFNAMLQISREKYCRVAVFSADKRATFLQAEKNRSPVKLKGIKQGVSSDGGDFDIQCGRFTDVSVVKDVGFSFKAAPEVVKKTVAEIKAMAAKVQVGSLEVRVNHVALANETVEVRGAYLEMQTCYIEDRTGSIKIQLWDSLIGQLVRGRSYCIRNVSTRQYASCLFLTTSRSTEIEEVRDLSLPSRLEDFRVEEDVVKTVVGEINAVEVSISQRCRKCQATQLDFNAKGKFHRCPRCKLLQKCQNYECIAKGKVSIAGTFGEEDFNVSNTVLKRYLTDEKLVQLLEDKQDVEEHLLSLEKCKIKVQNGIVVSLEKTAMGTATAASLEEEAPRAGSVLQEMVSESVVQEVRGNSNQVEVPAVSEDQEVDVATDADQDEDVVDDWLLLP